MEYQFALIPDYTTDPPTGTVVFFPAGRTVQEATGPSEKIELTRDRTINDARAAVVGNRLIAAHIAAQPSEEAKQQAIADRKAEYEAHVDTSPKNPT